VLVSVSFFICTLHMRHMLSVHEACRLEAGRLEAGSEPLTTAAQIATGYLRSRQAGNRIQVVDCSGGAVHARAEHGKASSHEELAQAAGTTAGGD